MIILFLLSLPIAILNGIANFLPVVDVLPFGIDAVLVQGMGYIIFLVDVFPPLQTIWVGLLSVLGFKLTLKLLAIVPILKGLLHK